MTEEKINELKTLLFERERKQRRIEELHEVLKINSNNVFYSAYVHGCDKPELICCIDDDGTLKEAMEKMYNKAISELNDIQKKIDEF